MDNLIQKFYSNGKEEQKYTQFGALSNNLNFKTTSFIKPNIGTLNPAMHNIETATTNIPKTPNRTTQMTQESFLRPTKLIFNGSSDLFNKSTLPSNKFLDNNNINTVTKTEGNIPSLHTMKQNFNLESKKNATKMQMMEEKMKNLELKSQRLEVINDFFFDMFENNLVKEEMKRQQNLKDNKNNKDKNENENKEDESDGEERKQRKRSKKSRKKKLKNMKMDFFAKNKEEMEINEFKNKTKSFARSYLNNVKNDIGMLMVEEQLRKNKELQDMTEDIIGLKGDLLNELERMQMAQNLQMKKIAYCLQNSGDEGIENLANRIFGDNILKSNDNGTGNSEYNSFNNTRISGSVFNPRESLFNTNMKTIKPSTNSTRKQSVQIAEKDDKPKSRKLTILDKETNIIPEEKNENENENFE